MLVINKVNIEIILTNQCVALIVINKISALQSRKEVY